jgi:hypothetical protein
MAVVMLFTEHNLLDRADVSAAKLTTQVLGATFGHVSDRESVKSLAN